jgi:hypothetical protein
MLEIWLSAWRDALLLAHGGQVPPGNPDQSQQVQWLSDHVGSEDLGYGLQRLDSTLEAIEANANLRLALETCMLDLPFVVGERRGS